MTNMMENFTLSQFRSMKNNSEEIIEYLTLIFKKICGNEYEKFKNEELNPNDEKYYLIDTSSWTDEMKENLYRETAKGIYYFVNFHSKKSSFPVAGFNSLLKAKNGSNFIQVYKKAVPNFSDYLISYLIFKKVILGKPYKKKNITSDDIYDDRNWLENASGTNDPETMNDVYWNLD